MQVLDKHLFGKTCICQDFHLTWCYDTAGSKYSLAYDKVTN